MTVSHFQIKSIIRKCNLLKYKTILINLSLVSLKGLKMNETRGLVCNKGVNTTSYQVSKLISFIFSETHILKVLTYI